MVTLPTTTWLCGWPLCNSLLILMPVKRQKHFIGGLSTSKFVYTIKSRWYGHILEYEGTLCFVLFYLQKKILSVVKVVGSINTGLIVLLCNKITRKGHVFNINLYAVLCQWVRAGTKIYYNMRLPFVYCLDNNMRMIVWADLTDFDCKNIFWSHDGIWKGNAKWFLYPLFYYTSMFCACSVWHRRGKWLTKMYIEIYRKFISLWGFDQ